MKAAMTMTMTEPLHKNMFNKFTFHTERAEGGVDVTKNDEWIPATHNNVQMAESERMRSDTTTFQHTQRNGELGWKLIGLAGSRRKCDDFHIGR